MPFQYSELTFSYKCSFFRNRIAHSNPRVYIEIKDFVYTWKSRPSHADESLEKFGYCSYIILSLILQYAQLVKNHGVDRSLIPPKKYFGFLQPDYVEKRRQALEAYFETLLSTFAENLPKEVLEFLETNKFVSDK